MSSEQTVHAIAGHQHHEKTTDWAACLSPVGPPLCHMRYGRAAPPATERVLRRELPMRRRREGRLRGLGLAAACRPVTAIPSAALQLCRGASEATQASKPSWERATCIAADLGQQATCMRTCRVSAARDASTAPYCSGSCLHCRSTTATLPHMSTAATADPSGSQARDGRTTPWLAGKPRAASAAADAPAGAGLAGCSAATPAEFDCCSPVLAAPDAAGTVPAFGVPAFCLLRDSKRCQSTCMCS